MNNQFDKIVKICSNLNIGNKDFWKFIKDKIHTYPLTVNEFPWACFPITNKDNILIDIQIVVPDVVDRFTLLVNIHELAHAYELYGLLGQECLYQVEASENFAREKEKLYLELVKEKS